MQSNSFNPISAGAQMSIKALYYDFCNFMMRTIQQLPTSSHLTGTVSAPLPVTTDRTGHSSSVYGSTPTDISESPT